MKREIINQIREVFYNSIELPKESIIEQYENKIDTYHENNAIEEELIIYEALMLLIPPIVDYIKSIELLKKIETEKSIILTAIIQFQNMGIIDDEIIFKLQKIYNSSNNFEKKSMICYILSLTNENKKEFYLIESIKLNPKTSLSYIDLALLYSEKGEKIKSFENFSKGLLNTTILDKNKPKNWVDYDFFTAEFVKGTFISRELYSYYKELKQEIQNTILKIESFILKDKKNKSRNEEDFVNIVDYKFLDKSKLDYDYLEGAIIITYNNECLLSFKEWDIIDQLWLYFLDAIKKLKTEKSVHFFLPDQPYAISISEKNTSYLTLSFNDKKVSIEKSLFISQIIQSARFFFEKLLELFPEYSSEITENIAFIEKITNPYKIHEGKEYTKEEWQQYQEEKRKNARPGTTWSLLDD